MTTAVVIGISAAVHALLTTASPATVVWRVGSIIVYSVDLQAIGTWTHIGTEVREIIPPPITDRDASSAVVFIALGRRPITPIEHRFPSAVLACPLSMSSSAVRCFQRADLASQTSATLDVAANQISIAHNARFSTCAPAFPLNRFCSGRREPTNRNQPTELPTGREWLHRLIIQVCHVDENVCEGPQVEPGK
jgi:hypothetical protein